MQENSYNKISVTKRTKEYSILLQKNCKQSEENKIHITQNTTRRQLSNDRVIESQVWQQTTTLLQREGDQKP